MNFNQQIKQNSKVVNHEGAEAYLRSPEMELFTAVVTTMMSDLYYECADKRVARIAELVGQVDPLFVAQLAIYARRELHLRSVPLLLLVELAKVHSGDSLVSRAIEKTLSRADEISELLACYQLRNKRQGAKKLSRLSHQVQEGLQGAFNKFGEYEFAKYDRSSQSVRLRDALFLVHPKAKDEAQQELFDKIAREELAVPYTWETQFSALGQQQFESKEEKRAARRQLWEELIDSGKLGYMALLRNLRNMLQSGVSNEHIDKICARLSDPDEVRRSKQMPFRFLAAYIELGAVAKWDTPQVMQALEEAACVAVENMEGFGPEENILLAADVSGSMQRPVSKNSSVQLYDIGLMMSMLLKEKCPRVVTGMFGDIWKPVQLPAGKVLENTLELRKREGEVGYSTNGHLVIDWLMDNGLGADKVMMFTDCQMWDSWGCNQTLQASWKRYKEAHPNAKLYLFDLSGYATAPFEEKEKDVYSISGWSDKVFSMLAAIGSGNSILDEIKSIEV